MELSAELTALARRIAQICATPLPELDLSPYGLADFSASSAVPAMRAHGRFEDIVREAAAANGVDPNLVDAIVVNESGFNPRATSSAGAQGLMQLMPATAAALGVEDPYNPIQNVSAGARYLRQLLDRFGGDVRLAVAAYNAGPGAVERYGGVPPYSETCRYVERVLETYRRARSAVADR